MFVSLLILVVGEALFSLVTSEAQFHQYPAYSSKMSQEQYQAYSGDQLGDQSQLTDPRPTPPRPRRQSQHSNPTMPRDLVTEIHCLKTENRGTFSSLLRLPTSHSAPPVIEGSPSNDCGISKTSLDHVFALEVRDLSLCGVRDCIEEGEKWLCLMVRFPAIGGLKLPEDEVIDIKCRPQDRSMAENSVLNFQENSVEQRSPAIFTGGSQEFLSEIGLFRRMAGTELFAARVKSGSVIELGEKVQLRSIVRSGDGWSYAKLTDVVVHRIHNGEPMTGDEHKMQLVSRDGCRNPQIKPLAKFNPWRDESNSLINNFDFRVFMFQEMESGDSIIITAQVVACVEEIDCEPVNCDDDDWGYGRKKRSVGPKGKTKGWESNVELKVSLPSDEAPVTSDVSSSREDECKLYLVLTLATALTFLVLSGVIVLVACVRRWQEIKGNKASQEETNKTDTASVRSNSSAGFKSRPGEGNAVVALKGSCNGHGAIPAYYFVPYDPRENQPQSPATSKPVTVRHVKRRDRVKTEERNRINSFSEKRGVGHTVEEASTKRIDIWRKSNMAENEAQGGTSGARTKEDERAVMV